VPIAGFTQSYYGAGMININMQPCTVCGFVGQNKCLLKKGDANSRVGSISVNRCAMCGTSYLGQYSEYFDDELYSYYVKYADGTKEQIYDSLTRKSYIQVLRLLELYNSGKSILDVGCGYGSFVDAALGQGYNVRGIELSQSAVNIAQGFGLPVEILDFFSAEIGNSSIDILTMFEVIEHVPRPIQFLRRAEQVVKPNGLIYLTTPNFNSIDRRVLGKDWNVFHVEHLTYFTPATLLNAIKTNTELEVLHLETRNISQDLLSRLVGRWRSTRGLNVSCGDTPGCQVSDFREEVEKSPRLLLLKRGINLLLDITSSGASIVLLLRRPG
jgi:2-polyprenyl-3-methyl-5-hydroxy-6-metoxy-1,4-benzoquinol methylase